MALGITNLQWPADKKVYATFSADSSYPNPSGYVVLASAFGLSSINRIDIPSTSGYVFFIDIPAGGASASIHVGESPGGGGGGVTGATSGGTPSATFNPLATHTHNITFTNNTGTPVGVPVYYNPATSTFNVDIGAGGPLATTATGAGTPSAIFNALATHTHTVSGGATAGPLVETANGTDLSSLTGIKATIYGY